MAGHGDRLSGVRLLLIEDSRPLRCAIRDLLEMEGATVIEAGTGHQALELARAQPFDLVLTDLGLPDMRGGEIIPQIRALLPGRTQIAVLSGAGTEHLAAALRAGADWAFAKPVEWDGLVRCLTGRAADRRGRAADVAVPLTVLVVEDDQALRGLLRETLERAGHRVIDRADGAELPGLVARERCDVVVLDEQLPGVRGLDLLATLQAALPSVPVILATAFGGADTAVEARRRGARGYLEKPFRMAEMLDALAALTPPATVRPREARP
jgi:DNA-binding response OmpR family regulator